MEAKEKAEELVNKFENVEYLQDFSGMNERLAVDCAIISADESLKAVEKYGRDNDELQNMENEFRFWDEVKSELEKMKG
ncbi:hypothetical protein CMU89_17015 [Elizabethkingia anophelis]|nr:hypothetical protein [Elizabethkingia anophelis]MDV3544342.1 hypothetical protein [Elizabethkingia anophelis]